MQRLVLRRGLRCGIIVTHDDHGGEARQNIDLEPRNCVGGCERAIPAPIRRRIAPCALLFTLAAMSGGNGGAGCPARRRHWGCACYGVVKLSLTCGDGWRGTAVDPGPICLMNTSVGDCLAEDDDRGGE